MDGKPTATTTPIDETQVFYRELERNHLVALWNVTANLLPKEPRGRAVPHLWRWDTLLPLVRRAGELAPLSRGAERRGLGVINPRLPSRYGATPTPWAGFQSLLPRQGAPAPPRPPAASPFLIPGDGAVSTLDS